MREMRSEVEAVNDHRPRRPVTAPNNAVHDASRYRQASPAPSSRSSQQSLAERSTPQFRSETDWKLTPGGHGLYGMNCPRSQVASVVDRPTTAMYAKDAEIAYYTKQPGAPSPLLWELWARREPSTAHNNSLERVAPPMASPVSHNFTAAVDKQTLQKNPLTEYLSVGPRHENHPGGLFYELGVRVHQVLQDHPTISKVSSQLSGSRRLSQTGNLMVVIEMAANAGSSRSANSSAGTVLHRWQSASQFARRVREPGACLPGCRVDGSSGSQRRAIWPHHDSTSSTTIRGKPLNVLNVQVLETDFLGKVTLLGKETISLAELSKCAESVAFTLYPRDNGQPLQLTLSVTHVKPTFTLAKVRANQENWN